MFDCNLILKNDKLHAVEAEVGVKYPQKRLFLVTSHACINFLLFSVAYNQR